MTYSTAKIFKNGQSQAVRLPKKFRFKSKEVYIQKLGDKLILSEKKISLQEFFQHNTVFGDDFLAERDNEPPQAREFF